MILADALRLAGLNRNTFNAIAREGAASFADGEDRNRFTGAHAVAFRCVQRFIEVGAPGVEAAKAVGGIFRQISDRVDPSASKEDIPDWLALVRVGGEFGWAVGNTASEAIEVHRQSGEAESAFACWCVRVRDAVADIRTAALSGAGLA